MARRRNLRVLELIWGEALLVRADGELEIGCARLTDTVAQARTVSDHWREYQCLAWFAIVKLEQEG
jgi:hypothetical protein